jgi:hypothetical protein
VAGSIWVWDRPLPCSPIPLGLTLDTLFFAGGVVGAPLRAGVTPPGTCASAATCARGAGIPALASRPR